MSTPQPVAAPPGPLPLERADDDLLTAMGLLAETFTALTRRSSALLAGHGLSPVEFDVMIRLARSPGGQLRMTDLSAQTGITSSGVTRVVDRLVERGLVARQACAADRRATYAVLGERGREQLAEVLPGLLGLIETWLVAPLRGPVDASGAGLEPFLASLRRLRDHLAPCATVGSDGRSVPRPPSA